MNIENLPIRNVGDTALWVAYYRALENERANPLFKDPLAKQLVGERGQQIAESMNQTSVYTQFNVLMRTVVIDRYLKELIQQGVDCVINVGAGLDTRPYRLALPAQLQWIEIDFPNMIEFKEGELCKQTPRCQLRRIPLDLNNRELRQKVLAELGGECTKAVILTEGVLPYLTEEQVSTLGEDFLQEKAIHFWIADYISSSVYKHLKSDKHRKKMQNAPFQFYPADWLGFFESRGWHRETIQYLPEVGIEVGREMPFPLIGRIVSVFLSAETKRRIRQSSGYMILKRKTP